MPATKPTKFEDAVAELLSGNKLHNLLSFSNFLKDNKLTKSPSNKAKTSWTIKYKTNIICSLRFKEDFWVISYFKNKGLLEKIDSHITTDMKSFILSNINTSPGCSGCGGTENKMILGKMFDRVCSCHLLRLKEPEGVILERAKELILICKGISER